jgi:hypothetical protein
MKQWSPWALWCFFCHLPITRRAPPLTTAIKQSSLSLFPSLSRALSSVLCHRPQGWTSPTSLCYKTHYLLLEKSLRRQVANISLDLEATRCPLLSQSLITYKSHTRYPALFQGLLIIRRSRLSHNTFKYKLGDLSPEWLYDKTCLFTALITLATSLQ